MRCSLGQVASPGGFGGADRGRGALRPPVCRQKLCRRRCRLPGWLGALLRGGERVAWCCRAGQSRGGQRVGSGARLQYARSGRVQCTHTRCSTQCRGMLQVAGEDGIYQIEVRSNGESSGHAGLIRGASSQCNAKTHVKTDHAHKVFDKMLRALRQVLEWPKTPDGGLFRCIRGW